RSQTTPHSAPNISGVARNSVLASRSVSGSTELLPETRWTRNASSRNPPAATVSHIGTGRRVRSTCTSATTASTAAIAAGTPTASVAGSVISGTCRASGPRVSWMRASPGGTVRISTTATTAIRPNPTTGRVTGRGLTTVVSSVSVTTAVTRPPPHDGGGSPRGRAVGTRHGPAAAQR